MRIATCRLQGIAPYSQSRAHESEPLSKETKDATEERTWREKCHTGEDGRVFIPPMAFKQALDYAAQMLSIQIPGRAKNTYTKYFASGVMCIEPLVLPFTKNDARRDRIYANADGKRGSGKRVWRIFPTFDKWSGVVPFHVMADEITQEVFARVITQAGIFVGIGRFRPQNGGFYGRFNVEKITWSNVEG